MEKVKNTETTAPSACVPVAAYPLRAARGLLCIFWGIPISIMLFSRALSIRHIGVLSIPPYVFGIVIIYTGAVYLYSAGRISPAWQALIKQGFLNLYLTIYFAPFVAWWEKIPVSAYLLTNVWLFFMCQAWLLHILNRIAREVAEGAGDKTSVMETIVCQWSVNLFMLFPLVLIYMVAGFRTLVYRSSLYVEVISILQQLPAWFIIFFLFPFTLTMANLWKAKNLCSRVSAGSGQ